MVILPVDLPVRIIFAGFQGSSIVRGCLGPTGIPRFTLIPCSGIQYFNRMPDIDISDALSNINIRHLLLPVILILSCPLSSST